ncbi:MAG: secretin and TonB N-terminal domain-containing protein [Elusimicrobia bacterium]|nr:secretin and TonB N-terminal domain-containing protein [Elusimicrobiota bacterium]
MRIKTLVFLMVSGAFLWAQNFEKITGLKVKVATPQKISVEINLTNPVNYYFFNLSNPPRFVAEFTSALVDIKKKEISPKNSFVKKIRIGQYKDTPIKISRVVFDLNTDKVFHDAVLSGDTIYLVVATKEELAKVKLPVPTTVSRKSRKRKPKISRNVPTPEHRKKVEEIKKQQAQLQQEIPQEEYPTKVETAGGFLKVSRKPISVNFYQADIRAVLNAIAEQTGINIIYGPDVQGTITLKLKNVAFDDALRLILKLSGLVVEKEAENIIRVLTPETLKRERSKGVQFTRVLSLKYTDAEDIKARLSSIKIEGISANITSDPLTNTIILTTTPDGLEKYQELIKIFDVKPRQVLIEASVVEVDYYEGLDLGITWKYENFDVYDKNTNNSLQGTVEAFTGTGQTVGSIGAPAGYFSIGGILNANQFTMVMNMLKRKNKTKTLSRPKVIAMNGEEAKILSGEKVPYTQTTVTTTGSTQSTSFTDVGIKLTVKPIIHSDEYVTMEVHPEVSSIREMRAEGPWIITREAETKVLAKNGEVIVIGGLIKEEDIKAAEQLPILGDLPILGYLFKHQQDTNDRVELLVFLKPIIIE